MKTFRHSLLFFGFAQYFTHRQERIISLSFVIIGVGAVAVACAHWGAWAAPLLGFAGLVLATVSAITVRSKSGGAASS